MDLHTVHQKISMITPVTMDQMLAAASLIARRPREEWGMLSSALGLDGVPTTLNKKARLASVATNQSID